VIFVLFFNKKNKNNTSSPEFTPDLWQIIALLLPYQVDRPIGGQVLWY